MLFGEEGGLYFWLGLVQLAKTWGSVSLEKTGVKFLCASGWQGQQVYRGRGVTELHHMQGSEKHYCACRLTGIFMCMHTWTLVYLCLCVCIHCCVYAAVLIAVP